VVRGFFQAFRDQSPVLCFYLADSPLRYPPTPRGEVFSGVPQTFLELQLTLPFDRPRAPLDFSSGRRNLKANYGSSRAPLPPLTTVSFFLCDEDVSWTVLCFYLNSYGMFPGCLPCRNGTAWLFPVTSPPGPSRSSLLSFHPCVVFFESNSFSYVFGALWARRSCRAANKLALIAMLPTCFSSRMCAPSDLFY